MRCTLRYIAPCASRCFQLRQPAELQMPNPTKTCPFPSTQLIPPHNHLHPWMSHTGRARHTSSWRSASTPAPPSSASWGSSPPSVGFQLDLEDPQMGGIWGRGDPCLYPCAALPPPFPARLRRLQALPRSKRSRWHAQHLRLRFPAAIAELLLSRAEAGGGDFFF